MSLIYERPLVKVYQGELMSLLKAEWESIWPAQTVITVPPWVRYAKCQGLADGRVDWTLAEEAQWQMGAVEHYAEWLPVLMALVADSNGRVWLIVHAVYLGPVLRVAYLLHWRTPQVWSTPGSELVIIQIGERVSRETREDVQDALDDATNPMEDEALLRVLIKASGGPVIDPFCGTGRTLAVALALGVQSTGIEVRQASCAKAIERLERPKQVNYARPIFPHNRIVREG